MNAEVPVLCIEKFMMYSTSTLAEISVCKSRTFSDEHGAPLYGTYVIVTTLAMEGTTSAD
jgi:hypothetical protein